MRRLLLTLWLLTFVPFSLALPQGQVQPSAAPSVVWIETYDKEGRVKEGGTGFFVQPDVVVTRLKLIASAHSARAFTPSNREGHPALGVVGVDTQAGLVLLKLEGVRGVALPPGDSEWTEPGVSAEVLGSNRDSQETRTPATLGEVSFPFYTLKGAIPPASYGGPVLRDGKVVGVLLSDAVTPDTFLAASAELVPSLVSRMTPPVALPEFRPTQGSRDGGSSANSNTSDVRFSAMPPPPSVDVVGGSRAPASVEAPRSSGRARARPEKPDAPVELPTTAPPPPLTTSPPPQESAPTGNESEARKEDFTLVRVFYGTDRNRTGAKEWAKYYGAGRGKLEMGTCEIGIPKTHQRGQLESPSWWRLEFSEDPTRHVMLRRVEPLGEGKFYEQYQSALGEAKTRDVFVFIHGYNVTFADAARRTAQLTYDLGFPGVPVFYSWPSQGSLTPIGYTTDETNVEWTEPHLKQFLKGLATQPGGARIHLVAHSMGNRALTKVMRALAAESDTPLFSEVILTAPDIDAAVFEEQLAPAIQKIARRVTLYASSNDNALIFSKGVHGYPRAGESGPTIIVTPGIDTIDASGIDTSLLGHSYYAEMQVVLKDMNDLLTGDKAPGERSLREQIKGAGKYWILAAVGMTPDAPGAPPGWRFGRVYPFLIIFAVVAVGLAVWLVLRGRRRTT